MSLVSVKKKAAYDMELVINLSILVLKVFYISYIFFSDHSLQLPEKQNYIYGESKRYSLWKLLELISRDRF